MIRSLLSLSLVISLMALRMHQCSNNQLRSSHKAAFEASPTCALVQNDLKEQRELTLNLAEIYSLGRLPGQCNPQGISEAQRTTFLKNANQVKSKILTARAALLESNNQHKKKAGVQLGKFQDSFLKCLNLLQGNSSGVQKTVSLPTVVPILAPVSRNSSIDDRIVDTNKKQAQMEKMIQQQKEERLKLQKEQEKQIQQKRQERQRLQKEQEKQIQMKKEQERIQREKMEQEKLNKQKAEEERIVRERAEQEKLAKQKAEQERVAKQNAQKERLQREQQQRQQLARQAELERQQKQKAEEKLRQQNQQQQIRRKEQQEKIKEKERLRLIALQKQRPHRDSQQEEIRNNKVKESSGTNVVPAIPVSIVALKSSALPKQLTTNPLAKNIIIDNRDQIRQRMKAQLDNNNKDYDACPMDTPYYDGDQCISCKNFFNLNTKECVTCPEGTKYEQLALKCVKLLHVSNLNVGGIWLKDRTIDQWKTFEERIRSTSPSTIVECPKDKPFAMNGKCGTCEGDKPVFDLVTSQCRSCPDDKVFNTDTKQCGPKLLLGADLKNVIPFAGLAQRSKSATTQQVRRNSTVATSEHTAEYTTNPSTYGVLIDTQSVETYTTKYNQARLQGNVPKDCPAVTPFFNGQKCIACLGTDNLFRLSTKTCTKCDDKFRYMFQFRSCLGISDK